MSNIPIDGVGASGPPTLPIYKPAGSVDASIAAATPYFNEFDRQPLPVLPQPSKPDTGVAASAPPTTSATEGALAGTPVTGASTAVQDLRPTVAPAASTAGTAPDPVVYAPAPTGGAAIATAQSVGRAVDTLA